MSGFEFEGGPPLAQWQQIAVDPVILAQEQTVAKLEAPHIEYYLSGATDYADDAYFDEIKQIQDTREKITETILQQYGVAPEAIEKSPYHNDMLFNYGGRYVRMSVNRTFLEVMTWDERLNFDERMKVWHAHGSSKMHGVEIGLLSQFLDTELPHPLKPYEGRIMRDIDGINAEKRAYLQEQNTRQERSGFLSFILESPHVSWSLPVAMSIIDMPISEGYKLTGRLQPEGADHLSVPRPGVFAPALNQKLRVARRLAPGGGVERINRDMPIQGEDQRVTAAVEQLETVRQAATEAARESMLPKGILANTFAGKALLKILRRMRGRDT